MYDQYQALIFDMDGTIIDSGNLHEVAWTQTLEAHGIPVKADIMRGLAGVPTLQTVEKLLAEFNLKPRANAEVIAADKEEFVNKNSLDYVRPTALIDVVKKYRGRKPMAIGTGASTAEAIQLLDACKIRDFFDVIIGADQVDRHKPAPDTFLLAAQTLKIAPERCVVFEDSPLGIQAAEAANMAVVDVQLTLGIRNMYFVDT